MRRAVREGFGERWRRRAITIPATFICLTAGVVLLPVMVVFAAVIDLVLRRPWSTVRLMLFGLVWLAHEAAGIVVAGVLWVAFVGVGIHSARSQRAHHRLQAWWVRGLVGAAEHLIGLRFSIEGESALHGGGPLIVMARHGSQGDAVLCAAVLTGQHDLGLRFVLKRELLWDPCLDLVGNRIPNCFVDRGAVQGENEVAAIAEVATDLGPKDAFVIFPEGTRYSPAKLAEAKRRIASTQPGRVEHTAGLRSVLPIRTSGTVGALAAAPEADILIYNHVGVDDFATLGHLWHNVPLPRPIEMRFDRIRRLDVPRDEGRLVDYLDTCWTDVDVWVTEKESAR